MQSDGISDMPRWHKWAWSPILLAAVGASCLALTLIQHAQGCGIDFWKARRGS